MYWPLGTPRIYATSSSRQPPFPRIVSHDGLYRPNAGEQKPETGSLLLPSSATVQDDLGTSPLVPGGTTPLTPVTPVTPFTPGIKPIEHDYLEEKSPEYPSGSAHAGVPLHEPILALRVARPGHIFAVITATSMTIWQTKVHGLLHPQTMLSWSNPPPANRYPCRRRPLRSFPRGLRRQHRLAAPTRLGHLRRPYEPGLSDNVLPCHRPRIASLPTTLLQSHKCTTETAEPCW